ncbi:hypothetical protein [Bradyrhizobium vignae]|uniref:hypothetical protein n=1 Tax=Bradyrhizobium vignae TaxID=1549949 RepID=UPI0011AE7C34|nr:hypothetical protein [Bradyrhizobium vignae]
MPAAAAQRAKGVVVLLRPQNIAQKSVIQISELADERSRNVTLDFARQCHRIFGRGVTPAKRGANTRHTATYAFFVSAFSMTASVEAVAQGAVLQPNPPTALLDPLLENQLSNALLVGCVMLTRFAGSSSTIAVPRSSELADKSVRISTPFLVHPTMGAQCQLPGQRCVGGVIKIGAYNPNSTSTNSKLPGHIFISVNIEAVSRRDCGG